MLLRLLIAVALAGPAMAQEPKAESIHEDEAVALARKIGAEVARFRGLEWKSDVDIAAYSIEQLTVFVRAALAEELPDERAGRASRAYRSLRLFPEGYELKTGLTKLLIEQIGGFYDPDAKQLRIVKRGSGDSEKQQGLLDQLGMGSGDMDRMVMAHELVHALQDQHFSLDRLPLDTHDDDDLVVAISSVVEGDATLSMMGMSMPQGVTADQIFAQGKRIAAAMKLFGGLGSMGLGGSMKEFTSAPKVLQESLMFPYMGGLSFCLVAGDDGRGFDGINTYLEAPPLSSEQVLHPQKLIGKDKDWPQILRLPEIATLIGPGVTRVYSNSLGELYTRVLLAEAMRKRVARKAAAGWDGDRYVLLERAGSPDALVWMTTWDSVEDATEFQEALTAWAKDAPGAPGSTASDWAPLVLPFKDGSVNVIGRRGVDVAWLHRVPNAAAPRILKALFESTQREERKALPRRKRKAAK